MRKAPTPVQELNRLHDRIRTHRIRPSCTAEFRQHCDRFEELLRDQGRDDGSIRLQEHWALLHELCDNAAEVLWHRQREVELIRRLLEIGGPVGGYDHPSLAKRLVALGTLYKAVREFAKAACVIREAEEIAEKHGFSLPDSL